MKKKHKARILREALSDNAFDELCYIMIKGMSDWHKKHPLSSVEEEYSQEYAKAKAEAMQNTIEEWKRFKSDKNNS